MERILFPVDFSKPCEQTAPVVAAWARQLGAEVKLLHAREGGANGGNLLSFAAAAWDGLKVTGVEREGKAAEEIVSYAAMNGVSLIMMPTHGTTRFRQLLLGSVTASVLHDAEVPVWTSAHAADLGGMGLPKRIVCAVDCGADTGRLVEAAQKWAGKLGAELRVLHSAPKPDARFESGLADKAHWLVKSNAREAYEKALPGGPALEIVEGETLVGGIVASIEAGQADLLLIGRGRLQGALGRLRTNAHELIKAAPCPVLSV